MTVAATEQAQRTFPVVEVFGPTIQGEGPDAGTRAFFVRIGGCDYRCSWCDSMHAVLPELVRHAPRMSSRLIGRKLERCGARPGDLIVLSGGNPALHHADGLVDELHDRLLGVSVETQGSVWRDWLAKVDRLVVSPKPPSSGEDTADNAAGSVRFIRMARDAGVEPAVKIVVFNERDYLWSRSFLAAVKPRPTWSGVSCGTVAEELLVDTAKRYRWLCERVARDSSIGPLVCLPQLHVIAWGHELGR